MAEAFKTPISPTDRRIQAGNNTDCDVRGTAMAEVITASQSFKHKFFVCADAGCAILGLDFLRQNVIHVDPIKNRLICKKFGHDIVIPCHSTKGFMQKSKVSLVRNYTIAPGAEAILPAYIDNKGKHSYDDQVCLIDKINTCFQKTGILSCRIVATPRKGKVPVRIINATNDAVRLWRNSAVGLIEPVIACAEMPADSEIAKELCSCECNCVSGKEDDGRQIKCCHGFEQKPPGDDRYEYLTVNQFSDTTEFFQKFEADKAVPEHLKQLYMATLPSLETVEQRCKLAQVLTDYSSCFATTPDDIGRTHLVKHTIDTGDAKPVHQRCRRLARAHVKVIREQVKKLSEAGIIRPSNSSWAANPVVVDKKTTDASGKSEKRMCIDYRGLNAVTINPDSYMLPRIDDTLDALSDAKYFCTLDLTQGYHQVELDEASKHKTAFHAPQCNPSQWEYNYMPFGLIKAPRTFQRLMDKVIQGLEYESALAYLDDVIVFGKTIDQTMERMVTVLQRLKDANLRLKAKKCELFKKEVSYLGHVITSEGVKTDPKKVEAVTKWHPPRTTKQVKSFMGTVNYYSRFVKDLATIAYPLHNLTRKYAKFKWGPVEQAAFDLLKKRLASAPVMAYPNQEGMFILDTDASDYAYGAVLSQMQKDDNGEERERVIAYASKKFLEREMNYCARRRELLAILMFVKHFDVYLRGVTFLIRTDHASLKYLHTMQNSTAQMFRWIMTLEEYSYKMEIRKGTLHGNADGLSRGCHGKQCICDEITKYEQKHNIVKGQILEQDTVKANKYLCSSYFDLMEECGDDTCVINAFKLQPTYPQPEIVKMQEEDPDISPVLNFMRDDPVNKPDWNQISPLSQAAKHYMSDWDRLMLYDGALYRLWESNDGTRTVNQLLVPRKLQMEFCSQVHDTAIACHMGRKKTTHSLLHFCYWHRMASDVAFWIKTCDKCQRRKVRRPTAKAPLQILVSGEPNERLQMDICGPLIKTPRDNIYILVITDMCSKYTEAFPMKDQTAETVADCFVKGWIKKKGPPLELHTDQGANFQSQLMAEVCKLMRIKKTRTSAYHPQGDGQVERYNKTMMSLVSSIVEKHEDWDEVIDDVTAAYNGTVHESTGFTPNFLWYGREQRFCTGSIVDAPSENKQQTYGQYAWKLKRRMQSAYDTVRMKLQKRAVEVKDCYDRNAKMYEYQPGEKVLIRDHTPAPKGCKKMIPAFSGPYYVLDRLGMVNYRIQMSEDSKPLIVHHNRIQEKKERFPYTAPEWVGRASKTLSQMEQTEWPEFQPPSRIPNALRAEDMNIPVQIQLPQRRYPRNRRQIKPKPERKRRGRPRKRPTPAELDKQEQVEQKSDEPEAAQVQRTRYGRAVRPPKRD